MIDELDPPNLGPALDVMRGLWRVNHELERLSARMARRLGITAQQRMILRVVGRFPGITSGRLSRVLCVDAATTSTALARLERRGLVTRDADPHDRRRVSVALTAKGRALDAPTSGTVESAVEAVLAQSPRKEIGALRRVLDELATSLRAQSSDSADARRANDPPRKARRTRTEARIRARR
jgi:DNA-binding MarR family transcriptional regulator